jgi:hypothetical protein
MYFKIQVAFFLEVFMKKTMLLAAAMLLACVSAYANCLDSEDGDNYYCKWGTACSSISTTYADDPETATCEGEVKNCWRYGDGLYLDNACATDIKATCGTLTNFTCTVYQEEADERCSGYYCKWGTSCGIVTTDKKGTDGSIISTCEDAIVNCALFSPNKTVYSNATCTTPIEGGISSGSNGSNCNITANGSQKCCMYNNDPANCWGIDGPNDKDGGILQTSETCVEKKGRVVDSCEDVLTDVKWCNYGTCQGLTEDGYGCLSGGCYMITETENANCSASRIVDECPAGTRPGDVTPSSSSSWPSSSSRPSNSSSSVREYAYCVWAATQECSNEGSHTSCPANGELRDTCPYSSSSSVVSSSSSGVNSGSSSSSSSGADSGSSSSSSVNSETYAYCVYITDRTCLTGPYTSCPAGGAPSNSCPYPMENTPILSHSVVHSNTLTAMQNAVNLQSMGNATIQIFNLKGKAVRTLKFSQGSYMVPLSGLPKGLYIVKASGASWKQTIKVAVK